MGKGRKKVTPTASDIEILKNSYNMMSISMLTDCLKKSKTKNREYSLEQKIISLIILQLNDMNYQSTHNITGVHRNMLHAWWSQYGDTVKEAEPDYIITKSIENKLALLMDETFDAAIDTVKKIRQLVNKTDNPRHIYPAKEALESFTEVLKLDKKHEPESNPGTFFSDLMKKLSE